MLCHWLCRGRESETHPSVGLTNSHANTHLAVTLKSKGSKPSIIASKKKEPQTEKAHKERHNEQSGARLTVLFAAHGAAATDKLTRWDSAPKLVAIWGSVIHIGPPCLCLRLGKHCRCSTQAGAAAVAARGRRRCCDAWWVDDKQPEHTDKLRDFKTMYPSAEEYKVNHAVIWMIQTKCSAVTLCCYRLVFIWYTTTKQGVETVQVSQVRVYERWLIGS